jgi:hypothetical protein
MAGRARAFSFEDGFSPRRITGERCRCGVTDNSPADQGTDECREITGLSLRKSGVRRHSRVGNSAPDDADDILVGPRRLERGLAEVDTGDLVAVLAMTAAAIGVVQFAAGVDFRLRITMLLRENRRSKRENSSRDQDKNPSWPHGSRLSVNVTSPKNPKS